MKIYIKPTLPAVEAGEKRPEPTEAMIAHWAYRKEHKLPPSPIFAVVHLPDSTQPKGTIQAWSIDRSRAKKQALEIGGRTNVVTFQPLV